MYGITWTLEMDGRFEKKTNCQGSASQNWGCYYIMLKIFMYIADLSDASQN